MKKEKDIVRKMIAIFCKAKHKRDSLCAECRELLSYAYLKLDKCPFKENKPACSKCEVHCYNLQMRKRIKEVMLYAGPRMICKHPVSTIRHMFT